MKVRKFIARNAGAGLAQVREQLGAEAVILSTRNTSEGVEILAIGERDLDAVIAPSDRDIVRAAPGVHVHGLPSGQSGKSVPSIAKARSAVFTAAPSAVFTAAPSAVFTAAPSAVPTPAPEAALAPNAAPASNAAHAPGTAHRALSAQAKHAPVQTRAVPAPKQSEPKPFSFADFLREPAQAPAEPEQAVPDTSAHPQIRHQLFVDEFARLSSAPAALEAPLLDSADTPVLTEIKALRDLMEERLETLSWSDSLRRRPLAATLMREMLGAGFSPQLARAILEPLPDDFGVRQARAWLRSRLTPALSHADASDDIVERGGRYALTGPTGVGKTTTTAKLAARCVVKYGAQSLGLITTDSYRIGAQDQLRIYGKILGVPVHTAADALALDQALDTLRDKRLVLIDTVGIGQRDERVAEQLAMLNECKINRVLLLAATSQLEILEDVIIAYEQRGSAESFSAGVILTKTDEAVKLAPAIDALIRHKLRLQYVSCGQRVPEDLHVPDCDSLLERALRSNKTGPLALSRDEAALLFAMPLSKSKSESAAPRRARLNNDALRRALAGVASA